MKHKKNPLSFLYGKIIFLSERGVKSYTLGPLTFICIFTLGFCICAFGMYFFGFKVASSAFLSKKELEIKRLRSINFALSQKINDIESDIQSFNRYLELNNVNKLDMQNNQQNLGQDATSSQSFGPIAFVDTDASLIKTIAGVDLNLVKSHQLLASVIAKKIRSVKSLDGDAIVEAEYEAILQDGFVANRLQNSIFEVLNLLNNIENANLHSTPQENQPIVLALYTKLAAEDRALQSHNIQNKILALITLQDKISSMPIGTPVNFIRITSKYGGRIDPKFHIPSFHHGLDLVGYRNAKVAAISNGLIIAAGQFSGYGNYIEINHGNGIKTGYAHLKKVFVKKGDKVSKGDIIGIQGSTGKSTGDHLHYEIKINNQRKNPEAFIKKNENTAIAT